jgi:3-oxoacyl-[acyl-carrier-protein] synthase II
MISDIACGHISIKYGLEALTSQPFRLALLQNAIIDAFNLHTFRTRRCYGDWWLRSCGNYWGMGFNAMHALSTRNDDPKQLPDLWTKTEMDLY